MALVVTNTLAFTLSTAGFGTGTFTTASFTPGSGKRLVVRLMAMSNQNDSLAGSDLTITDSMGPLTWTAIVGSASTDSVGWGYAARAWISSATTGAGSMTLSFDAGAFDVYRYGVIVDIVEGEDASPVGGTATGNDADGDGAASITLSATPVSTSHIFALAIRTDSGTSTGITPGTGWTEDGQGLDDLWLAFQTQRRTGTTSTSVDWNDLAEAGATPAGALMLAFEIKEAAGTPVGMATETDTALALSSPPAVGLASETDTAQPLNGINFAQDGDLFLFGDDSGNESSMGGLKVFGGFVASGVTIAIGLVTETDTAQPITARHVRSVAQVTETDSAQAITARLARSVAQASETDTAQPMVARVVRAVAQVSEADTAQSITLGGTASAVGQVVETDTAQPITGRLLRAVGQVLETDTAQPVAGTSGVLVAQVVETDTAQPILPRYSRTVAQALETDTAQPLTARHIRTVQQAVETDTAQTILLSVPGQIGIATETDSAQPIVARVIRAIGIVTETDTAQAVTLGSAGGTVGQAQETDTAQPITARVRAQLGQAQETDSALQMRVAIGRAVAQAIETDQALAMAQRQLLQIGIVTEIDTALLITYPGYGDELSEAYRYDVPSASLRYDIPAASLRFDVPSIGSAITIT